jgi:MFS family permease
MEQVKTFIVEKAQTGVTSTLALSMLLASLGTSIANIALPTLAEAFSATFTQVQAVVVAYLVALTVSAVLAGLLADSRGLKPMLLVGLTVFAFASLLCAIAPNLSLLVGARALQGIGAAFMMTIAMALMRQTASKARVGRAMGLLGTVSALGTALGPSLGGLLIPLMGWRSIFWVQVPIAVLALVLAITLLSAAPGEKKAQPLSLWSVMNRNLAPTLLVNIVVAAVMMTTLVVGPFYLGIGLGLTATQVGFVMAVGPVISIFSGIPSGRLVDACGTSRMLAIGLALLAIGAFMLALLPNSTGVTGYLLAIIVLTPGYQLFQAANNTAALAEASKERSGTVAGLLSLSRNIGLIAGASAMGAVFSFGVGTEEFTRATSTAITSGMRLTFLLAGTMLLAATGLAFRHNNPSKRPC